MRALSRSARLLTFASAFLAAVLAAGAFAGAARAAPQIVAAVPSNGEVALVCDGGECAAEFSTVCLQQSRPVPGPGKAYGLHRADGTAAAVTVTGHKAGGGTMSLDPDVLAIASRRGQVAFRFSVPAAVLKRHRLAGVSVRVERLAVLVPRAEAGDSQPQTAADVARAVQEAAATGGYWSELNTENLAMARISGRVINRLPPAGSVSPARARALWEKAAAREKGLPDDALEWSRRFVDHCRKSAEGPGSFPMRRCLGRFHDRAMQDLNVRYWDALRPGS